jgi:hypothetical protein
MGTGWTATAFSPAAAGRVRGQFLTIQFRITEALPRACARAADAKIGGPRYVCRARSRISTAAVASNGIVAAAKNAG